MNLDDDWSTSEAAITRVLFDCVHEAAVECLTKMRNQQAHAQLMNDMIEKV